MKSIFVNVALCHDSGNTYHSCAIETDGATIYAPFQYGYGTQYKYTALEALKEAGLISCEHNEVCRWERDNGYPIEWSVSEGTQTECRANGKHKGASMTNTELNKEAIEIAEDYGVDANTAVCLIELLGENELHDGFISALEDAASY